MRQFMMTLKMLIMTTGNNYHDIILSMIMMMVVVVLMMIYLVCGFPSSPLTSTPDMCLWICGLCACGHCSKNAIVTVNIAKNCQKISKFLNYGRVGIAHWAIGYCGYEGIDIITKASTIHCHRMAARGWSREVWYIKDHSF